MLSNRWLLVNLIADGEEPMERKQKALAECADTLKLSAMVRYLESLELTEFLELLEGKQTTLGRSPGNEALLKAPLSRNWIVGYNVDEQDDTLFQTQGKAALQRKVIKQCAAGRHFCRRKHM